MIGIVCKSTGSWYTILNPDGTKTDCRIKGKFRTKNLGTTNPIAVGDKVKYELEENSDQGIIEELLPRENYIIRRATNLSHQSHIIAANIDLAALVVTLVQPRTSFGFIDRFLVTAEAYHIPAAIVFNKIDLYRSEELALMEEYIKVYQKIGYTCLSISALKGDNFEDLEKLLYGKTTLFSGHSGVGKSTLINRLLPDKKIKTKEISDYSAKGVHTTTFAEMHPLRDSGFIIDSPGIKELGVVDMEKSEIPHYFPEFKLKLNTCKFNNCKHLNEPGCAVLNAVEKGEIALSRYESYFSIVFQDDDRRR